MIFVKVYGVLCDVLLNEKGDWGFCLLDGVMLLWGRLLFVKDY